MNPEDTLAPTPSPTIPLPLTGFVRGTSVAPVRGTPHKLQTTSPQNWRFNAAFPVGFLAARALLTPAGPRAQPHGAVPPSLTSFPTQDPCPCVTPGSLVARRRLREGAGVRSRSDVRGPGREPAAINPCPGIPRALPALPSSVPHRKSRGCSGISKEKGRVCRGRGSRDVGPWGSGGSSPF